MQGRSERHCWSGVLSLPRRLTRCTEPPRSCWRGSKLRSTAWSNRAATPSAWSWSSPKPSIRSPCSECKRNARPPVLSRNQAVEDERITAGPRPRTAPSSAAPQSAQEASMCPVAAHAAQTPSASHAQLAYHHRSSTSTRYDVRTAENGLGIRIPVPAAWSTSARAPSSRRHPARTSSAGRSRAVDTSSAEGAPPTATNKRYVSFPQYQVARRHFGKCRPATRPVATAAPAQAVPECPTTSPWQPVREA